MTAKADAKLTMRADTGQAQSAVDAVTKRVESMQPSVEKAATAASGLSSALGSVGTKAGSTLGAVSNFAMAFSAGGPVLAATAVASVALSAMAEKWFDVGEAAKQARTDQVESLNQLADEIDKATLTLDARIAKAGGFDEFAVKIAKQEKSIEGLKEEYNELIDQGAFKYAKSLNIDVTDAQDAWLEQLNNLDVQIEDATFKVGLATAAYEEYAAKNVIVTDLEGRRAKLLKELADKIKAVAKEQKDLAKAQVVDDADAHVQAFRELEQKKQDEREAAVVRQQDFTDKLLEDNHANDLKRREDAKQIAIDRAQETADELKQIEEDLTAHKKMMESQKMAFATQTANIVLGSTLNAIEGIVAGEEFAVQHALVSIAKQTGSAVIGFGASTVAAGIGKNAIVPGSGVDTVAVGAGLIAAGVGIGGVGAVAGGLLSRSQGGGSGSARTGATDVGFGRSDIARGRVTGSEATVVIAGGQVIGEPTDAARATARNLNRARKRLFLD